MTDLSITDDRALTYFAEVVSAGSIRAAARRLFIGPPALSRTISSLEQRVGEELLHRHATGVRPTPAGEALLRYVRAREDLDAILADELSAARNELSGKVRIAVGEGFLTGLIEEVLPSVFAEHPAVSVEVLNAGTSDIRQAVIDADVDYGIGAHVVPDAALSVIAESTDSLAVAVSPHHPLAEVSMVTCTMLAEHAGAFLLPGFGLRALTDDLQRDEGTAFRVRMETGSVNALVAFAASGAGYALLPGFVTRPYANLVSRPISAASVSQVTASLLAQVGRPVSLAASELEARLSRYVQDLNDN